MMKKLNPFMLILAAVQFMACLYEYKIGNYNRGNLYVCYTIANILLSISPQ